MSMKRRARPADAAIIIVALAVLAGSPGLGIAQTVRETLPIPDPPFQGKIGLRGRSASGLPTR
jgi:hypothetical protein